MAIISFKFVFLFVLVALLIKPSVQKIDYDYEICSEAWESVKVSGVEISPKQSGTGKSHTSIFASTDTSLEGAYYKMDVKLGYIKIFSKSSDLCDVTTCPVPIGSFVMSYPSFGELPRAKYRVHIELFDKDDQTLACIDIRFQITDEQIQ